MNHITDAIAARQAGLFTILAALIAVLGAFSVQRFISKRAAAAKFRAAIHEGLVGLYPIPTDWPKDGLAIREVLKARFQTLQPAVADFSHHLPNKQRMAFAEAWHSYHCSTGRAIDAQDYLHYMPFGSQPDPKKRFHLNVARLLLFAKEA